VTESLGDLLGRLGAELLPTERDVACFLEYARDVLATNAEVKRRLKDAGLLSVPIDTPARKEALLVEIQRALPRVLDKERLPIGAGKVAKKAAAGATLRAMIANFVIVKGVEGVDSRETLLRAMLFLRDSERDIKELQTKASGGTRIDRSVDFDLAIEWARHAAAEWREKNPGKSKTTELAQSLYGQARKRFPGRWQDAESLRVWMYRNGNAIQLKR
jgi:hypothetical protein